MEEFEKAILDPTSWSHAGQASGYADDRRVNRLAAEISCTRWTILAWPFHCALPAMAILSRPAYSEIRMRAETASAGFEKAADAALLLCR